MALYTLIINYTIGELILSDQVNVTNAEINITLIPDMYDDILMKFIMDENITVSDNMANISNEVLCSSAAAPIRDALTNFASVEYFCAPECG